MSEYETKLANEIDILKAKAEPEPAALPPEQTFEQVASETADAKQHANEQAKHNHDPIPVDAAIEAFAHLGDDQAVVNQALIKSKPSKNASHDNEFRDGVDQDFVPDSAMIAAELAEPPHGPDDYFGPLDQPKKTIEDDPPSGDDDDDDDSEKPEKKKSVKKPRKPKAMSPDDYAFYIPD